MLHGANHAILCTLHYIFILVIDYLMSVCVGVCVYDVHT